MLRLAGGHANAQGGIAVPRARWCGAGARCSWCAQFHALWPAHPPAHSRQQTGKFFTAVARCQVARALEQWGPASGRRFAGIRHRWGDRSEFVGLEVIDVHQHQRQRLATATGIAPGDVRVSSKRRRLAMPVRPSTKARSRNWSRCALSVRWVRTRAHCHGRHKGLADEVHAPGLQGGGFLGRTGLRGDENHRNIGRDGVALQAPTHPGHPYRA